MGGRRQEEEKGEEEGRLDGSPPNPPPQQPNHTAVKEKKGVDGSTGRAGHQKFMCLLKGSLGVEGGKRHGETT